MRAGRPIIMKFRTRVVVLVVVIFVISVVCFISEPWLGPLEEELSPDYMDFSEDESSTEVAGAEVASEVSETSEDFFRFPFGGFNASSRQRMIEQFIGRYDVNWNFEPPPEADLWKIAGSWVTPEQIHGEHVPELGAILSAMSSWPIIKADVMTKGSQLKLLLFLDGGQGVLFKPQWYNRDYIVEGKPYDGHDRHNGEIVAFHFNRLLGFNRVPLTIGRVVDLETEILPVATEQLKATFFKNGSNTCFYGKCLYCKGKSTGVCANGTRMEGAVILGLPPRFMFIKYRHPWGRTYREGHTARWEHDDDDDNYCADVKNVPLYGSGRLLLDIIDACVFDYIMGNADRHHFEMFLNESASILIMFDNGKSFGNPFHDEESILAPLKQCKRIRSSTVRRLHMLRHGVLSKVLGDILSHDPLAPLLTSHHFHAMDGRLEYTVKLIEKYAMADPDVLVEVPVS